MDRNQIAIEYMKIILSTDRFSDYTEEENIMQSIAKDAFEMADTMISESERSLQKQTKKKIGN